MITKDDNNVYYHYRTQGMVTIHYVDQNSKEISNFPPITVNGNGGDKYETNSHQIPGYNYDHITGNATDMIIEDNSDVYYHYDHEGNKLTRYSTVHYVDQNDNEITGVPTEIISGAAGIKYTTIPKNIAGYKYSYYNGNPTTGTFNTEDGAVYYYYVSTIVVENNDKGSCTMVSMTTIIPSYQP